MQSQIREVWSDNLDAELDILRELIDRYPYVSMVSSLVIDVGMFTQTNIGYRISRCRSKTYRKFQKFIRLSLSDFEM